MQKRARAATSPDGSWSGCRTLATKSGLSSSRVKPPCPNGCRTFCVRVFGCTQVRGRGSATAVSMHKPAQTRAARVWSTAHSACTGAQPADGWVEGRAQTDQLAKYSSSPPTHTPHHHARVPRDAGGPAHTPNVAYKRALRRPAAHLLWLRRRHGGARGQHNQNPDPRLRLDRHAGAPSGVNSIWVLDLRSGGQPPLLPVVGNSPRTQHRKKHPQKAPQHRNIARRWSGRRAENTGPCGAVQTAEQCAGGRSPGVAGVPGARCSKAVSTGSRT
jgi:hypothetical protein